MKAALSNTVWIIASCVLLLAVFSNLDFDIFFSSDTLYLPCLYKDFAEQHSLAGWHLNPSPNFFPDMLVYFVVMLCCGGSLLVASAVFAVLQYFAILLLMRCIFKLVLPAAPAWYHHITCLLLSLPLLELFFPTYDPYYAFYLVSNSYHTGAFTMGLACLALTLRYTLAPSKKIAWLLFTLIVLSTLSDKLFIMLYSIPALVTFACLYKRIGWRISLRIIVINAMAVFAGLFVFNNIDKKTGIHFDRPAHMFNLQGISDSLAVLAEQLKGYLGSFGFRSVSLYVFIAAFVMACMFCIRLLKRKESLPPALFVFFFLVYSLVVWLAPVLNGSYPGFDCIRYNIYPVYFAALAVPVMIAYYSRNLAFNRKPVGAFMGAGFSLMLLCLSAWHFRAEGLESYFSYYPDIARKVDEVAAREQLHHGVGDYWKAKKVTMFSKRGVTVRAVFDDLAIWDHVASERWFFTPGIHYDFVLLDGLPDTARYKLHVHPLKLIAEDGVSIVKTSPFYYNRALGGNLPVNAAHSE